MKTNRKRLPLSALALTAAALLAACGGGGDSPEPTVSSETAQSVSGNAMVQPAEGSDALGESLKATQTIVASGSASATIACPGGGSAVYTVTGGANLGNGQLDAGETYAVTYNACRAADGAPILNGSATLTVTAAAAGSVTVNTSTQNLAVTLPLRTLTFNGSSTITRSVETSGATTVTTTHWVSPQITVTSQRLLGTSTLTYSNVDYTRSISVTNGTLSGYAANGTLTLNATLLNGNTWSATIATQGLVSYDANGVPTQGTWTLTLPQARLVLTVATGTATLTVDQGLDGTIDATYTFTVNNLTNQAG